MSPAASDRRWNPQSGIRNPQSAQHASEGMSTKMPLKVLFIGDVVGAPGRKILGQVLPRIIPRWGLGLVVCNAENAAGGSGLTLRCHEELVDAGVDVMTMGDHVYRKDEIFQIFEKTGNVLRPANFPEDSPGSDLAIVTARDGTPVAVFSVLGRTYMRPVDCPFRASDRILDRIGGRTSVIIVDVHAEATSDKQLLGRYLDGRVSAVLGTHTHVVTADEQILKNGSGYQTDVGMTGPHDSIIGRRYDRVLSATLTFVQNYFDVATGDPRLNGVLLTIDPQTGHALTISRVSIDQQEAQRLLTDLLRGSPRIVTDLTPVVSHTSSMALSLAGHGDEPHRRQHLAFQARLGPGDPNEVLVVATDRSHEPSADFELIEQRLRDVNRRGGGQEDRVVRARARAIPRIHRRSGSGCCDSPVRGGGLRPFDPARG